MPSATPNASHDASQKRGRSKIVLPRVGEVLLLAVAVFCLAVVITQDLNLVVRFLYSPLAILLLVVVFVEFLIIKGGDRSRLYRIEIDKMREREQEQVARTRKAVEEIRKAQEFCRERNSPTEEAGAVDDNTATELQESLARIDKLLRPDLKE